MVSGSGAVIARSVVTFDTNRVTLSTEMVKDASVAQGPSGGMSLSARGVSEPAMVKRRTYAVGYRNVALHGLLRAASWSWSCGPGAAGRTLAAVVPVVTPPMVPVGEIACGDPNRHVLRRSMRPGSLGTRRRGGPMRVSRIQRRRVGPSAHGHPGLRSATLGADGRL